MLGCTIDALHYVIVTIIIIKTIVNIAVDIITLCRTTQRNYTLQKGEQWYL